MLNPKERNYLRSLAERYKEISLKEVQDERRELWRDKNSLKTTRPLIYVRACAWGELEESKCTIKDPFFKHYENYFKRMIYQDSLDDDFIIEPWVTLDATQKFYGWGVCGTRHHPDEEFGAWKDDYPIKELDDIKQMVIPKHVIDEEKTSAELNKLQEAIGDIIEVNLSRGSAYKMWTGDISTELGHLRGIENFMMDMMDNPEWLHTLVAFMSKGILKSHEEAEEAGDWSISEHANQAMPYSHELDAPVANKFNMKRDQLWYYMASQEFTAVSPRMQEEFLLKYQLPILSKFGLVAYGCCEDLTNKIDILRTIPNLRRIAVSPFANVAKCAEQIKNDYVLSYRPSPADMVSYDFDKSRVRKILSRELNICKESYVDITLKDVETVQKDSGRIKKWVAETRSVISEIWG